MNDGDASSPMIWQDGQPRSRLFGDIYYSLEDGLAETKAVFLDGCDLPYAWSGRRHFCVAELGFGTGLNIAALLDLWAGHAPEGGHLHIFSVEGFPLEREEAARALGGWPQIAPAAKALLDQWPGSRRGFHRLDLTAFSATLDLAIMDVAPALSAWSGVADAWFLDGFSPALNPHMWSEEILALVGSRSTPGAAAATFTVAGTVRRGLAAAGFEVAKRPGHGRKRERLVAIMPGESMAPAPVPRVIVVGGGIAAASLVRAFAALGAPARAIHKTQADRASGNRAAQVTPALDAGGGARAAFYAQAFARAVALYDRTDAVIARGALQLEAVARDAARYDAVAAQDIFEPGAMGRLSGAEAASRLGEDAAPAALAFRDARVVEPQVLLDAWLGEAIDGEVVRYESAPSGWRVVLADDQVLEADILVLAAGWETATLAPGLPIKPVRGQATFCALDQTIAASASGGYVVPARGGVLFGATHDRDETDTEARDADNARNRASMAVTRPAVAALTADLPGEGRASVRAATPDRMPIAGQIAQGLFVLTGLGSRGFTTAPLLSEHVAALALGAPSPLPRDLAGIVSPARFGS